VTPLFKAALDLQNFLHTSDERFCVIGGIAVLRWGQPRFTRDVDVTILTGWGGEDRVIDLVLSASYNGRISEAAEFARRNRVLLIESQEQIPIDIALGALPFEERMIERATLFEFERGCELLTCSAEDLLVQKLFAMRSRDIADAEGIVARQRNHLDWSYITQSLLPLTEGDRLEEVSEMLRRLRQ
jgi:hypothetical protein